MSIGTQMVKWAFLTATCNESQKATPNYTKQPTTKKGTTNRTSKGSNTNNNQNAIKKTRNMPEQEKNVNLCYIVDINNYNRFNWHSHNPTIKN